MLDVPDNFSLIKNPQQIEKDIIPILLESNYLGVKMQNFTYLNTDTFNSQMDFDVSERSAFGEDHRINGMSLVRFLRINRVTKLYIYGDINDSFVVNTIIDALGYNYKVSLILESENLTPSQQKNIRMLTSLGMNTHIIN